jgi:prepilin-type processing-associated H-X9-DG protein
MLIILPMFAHTVDHAPKPTCERNLRQLGAALIAYAQDYDEKMVPGHGGLRWPGIGWAGQVFNYIKSPRVYQCPEDTTSEVKNAGTLLSPVSYAYSAWVAGLHFSHLKTPQTIIVMQEISNERTNIDDPAEANSPWYSAATYGDNMVSADGLNAGRCCGRGLPQVLASGTISGCKSATFAGQSNMGRHDGWANWLMADGHVKYLNSIYVSHSPRDTAPGRFLTCGRAGMHSCIATFDPLGL